MYIRTLIHAIKEIQLIVQQSSVLYSVCELAVNLAFAQASKQFDANRPSAVILLHLYRSVKRYLHPFAMKGLQKMCIFYQNGTKVYQGVRSNVPQDGASPFKSL